jgi:hypothetical protein
MRLSVESSEEDRLALFQAIRDSGYVSDEEGFYLVSWHIETMADVEAATKMRDIAEELRRRLKQFSAADHQLPQADLWVRNPRLTLDSWRLLLGRDRNSQQ